MKLTTSRKLFLGLVLFAVISGVYLLSVVKKSPSLPPPQPGIESANPEIRSITYQKAKLAEGVEFPVVPQSLPAFSQNRVSLNLFGQAQKLARHFDLLPVPNRTSFWLGGDKKKSLSIDIASQVLTFQVDSYQSPESYVGKDGPETEAAIKSAQDFVNAFENWREFKPNTKELIFFKGEGAELIETNPQEAAVILIPFTQFVNNIPVRIEDQTQSPLTISIAQKNQVVKITARPQVVDISSPKEYYIVSEKEALNLLDQGRGKIIQVAGQALVESLIPLKDISQIIIQAVSLEYRLDTQANLLIPYYNLKGIFSFDSSPTPNTVVLILPAVKL